MATRLARLFAAAAIAALALVPTHAAQRAGMSEQLTGPLPFAEQPLERLLAEMTALQGFEQRVNDYVVLHRLLEGPLPPMQVSNDMRKVRAAMDALALKIQAARRDADQGEIFTPEVAPVLRRRILTSLTPEDMQAVLTDREEGDPPPPSRLAVNQRWPERMPFNFVPPQLLAALPPLPPELEYRIIGRSLVLWDHHANLIVDFLPGAFTS